MYLKEGQAYYFEGIYTDHGQGQFIHIGLHKETTTFTASDVPMAVQEYQQLVLSSARDKETQVRMCMKYIIIYNSPIRSLFGLCGVDDVVRHLICMLQKLEYLWNMRY